MKFVIRDRSPLIASTTTTLIATSSVRIRFVSQRLHRAAKRYAAAADGSSTGHIDGAATYKMLLKRRRQVSFFFICLQRRPQSDINNRDVS